MTSPHLFLPKAVGASLVVNSLTKYIGGHGNALGGTITDTGLFDWSRFPNIYDSYKGQDVSLWGITQIKKKGLRDMGGSLGPEAAHHLAVGSETLPLRMDRACANAIAVARLCDAHPLSYCPFVFASFTTASDMSSGGREEGGGRGGAEDRKSTRLNSSHDE